MKKKMFLAGIASMFLFCACDHWPPGLIVPQDEDDDETATEPARDEPGNGLTPNLPVTDEPGNGVFTPDAGIDAPQDTPDAKYIPDSGTPAGTPNATTDGGSNPDCVCICEDNDECDEEDGVYPHHHGHGAGRWKLHCHQGGHCHQFFGEGEECERGYHCHLGHDCDRYNGRGHPECEADTSPIYDPIDTCGNPCECPENDDLEDGDDENYDEDDEENED